MILVIDNYDSFTYNLVDYIGRLTSEPIEVHRNDKIPLEQIAEMNPFAIVLSPGPKRPQDAGICLALVRKFTGIIPILGVCLGHQSICEALGGQVISAKRLMHGMRSEIVHRKDELFAKVSSPFYANRYHSLAVDAQTLPAELIPTAFTADDMELMAVRHISHPTFGLQFHPESVYTPDGLQLIENFFRVAQEFRPRRIQTPLPPPEPQMRPAEDPFQIPKLPTIS